MAAPVSKFRRLSITHAAMTGGDAAMIVALADSLFFSIDPDAARTRVLLFLVISFAPFLLVAPVVGPAIDRAAGGRRAVIQVVAVGRIVLCLLIGRFVEDLVLFPLVFAALVLQKAYVVSKLALVPSVVRTEAELVEAHSKLGLIAGITGFAAVLPAALLQTTIGAPATMIYASALFGVGLLNATRLPPDVVADHAPEPAERVQLRSTGLQLAAAAMMILRCAVGFMFFHLAFWLRTRGNSGTALFGVAIAMSALGTMIGNGLGPRLRRQVREELMLMGALGLTAVGGVIAALVGGVAAGIGLAMLVNAAAALGRLAFESIVQRDAPGANRGRAFARFETRFQLGWVLAGLIPVVITIPGPIGFLLVGVMAGAGLFNYVSGSRSGVVARRPAFNWRRPIRRPQP